MKYVYSRYVYYGKFSVSNVVSLWWFLPHDRDASYYLDDDLDELLYEECGLYLELSDFEDRDEKAAYTA